MRVLLFTTLFPNAAQPNHGVFVETRLRETLALGGLQATVIAPVPYFPSGHPAFGRYGAFARAPGHEVRDGIEVWRPRYAVVPKVGARWAVETLFRSALSCARGLGAAGQRFEVIDAHYFHPDGVVAARLGRALGLPVVITARGSDLTQIALAAGPRAQIAAAAAEASACVAVCQDLADRLVALGAPAERTVVLRNGVDLARFAPRDRAAAREALGVSGFVIVSVGALIPRKGHALTLSALARTPGAVLLIAGSGPDLPELARQARRLGVEGRVRFLGEVAHAELPRLYSAADVFVLASSREGWANVLLEAMACGTPVIATDVNGTAEVVRSPEAGMLLRERSPDALAERIAAMREAMPPRDRTRRYAERFGWRPVAEANRALLVAAAQAGYGGRRSRAAADAARAALRAHETATQVPASASAEA